MISERQREAPSRSNSLTADSARRLAQDLTQALNQPAWLLDVSLGAGDSGAFPAGTGPPAVVVGSAVEADDAARWAGLGSGPGPRRVRAGVMALPFASGSVPAAHLGPGLGAVPDWRRALAEVSRVLRPEALLATALGAPREDAVVVEVLTHFQTTIDVVLARRPAPAAGPDRLQRPEQVDAELDRLGYLHPRVLDFRGECVLSARDIVEAATRNPARVPAGSDPVALEEVAAKTLAWAAARFGGPDVPVLLGARRAYRIYCRR